MTEKLMTEKSRTSFCHQCFCPQAVVAIHSSEPIIPSFETIWGVVPALPGANVVAPSRIGFGTISQASRRAMFIGPTETLFQRARRPRNDQRSNDVPKPAMEIVETTGN
jgi:hypothetical protein